MVSESGTFSHSSAGYWAQTRAKFEPQKVAQGRPLMIRKITAIAAQKPGTACRSRQKIRRFVVVRRGSSTPQTFEPLRGHQR